MKSLTMKYVVVIAIAMLLTGFIGCSKKATKVQEVNKTNITAPFVDENGEVQFGNISNKTK